MKIILEGTVKELQNALHTFGIPKEAIFDDGTQFLSQKDNVSKSADKVYDLNSGTPLITALNETQLNKK